MTKTFLSRIGFEPMTQESSTLCSNLTELSRQFFIKYLVFSLRKLGKIGFEPMMNFFITIFKIDTLNHSVTYLKSVN